MTPEVQLKLERAKELIYDFTRFSSDEMAVINKELDRLYKIENAVRAHHAQKADDRCWMDDALLYEAAGLPLHDPRVGDKEAMLHNCKRFVELRCMGGGPWPSYAELEAKLEELQKGKGKP